MKKSKLIVLIFSLFLLSCSKDKENTMRVILNKKNKISIDSTGLSVILIKSFPNINPCREDIKNANLYLCEVTETNDTILLYEPCQEMPDFAKNNYKEERDLLIEKKYVINGDIKELYVSIADSTIIKKKYKYVIGSLTSLIY